MATKPGPQQDSPPARSDVAPALIEGELLRGPSRREIIATRLLAGMLQPTYQISVVEGDRYVRAAVWLADKLILELDAADGKAE